MSSDEITAGITAGAAVAKGREAWKGKHHPYKMLLFGETGSGKTSFLNLLCNCALIQELGCKFDEHGLTKLRQFNDIKLENAQSHRMQSKTSGVKLYKADMGEMMVGIIDTPGFGDSRGMEQDKKNTRTIVDSLQDEEYVHCVCLIINGRQAIMSVTLQYVLSQITSILPREVLDNVIVVFTNTAGPLSLNFDPDELEGFLGQKIRSHCIFYVENPYCLFQKAKMKHTPLAVIAKDLQKSFEGTSQVLDEMCTAMKDFKMVHTNRFITLYEKKQEIEKGVLTLLTAYDHQRKIERMIRNAQEEADAALKTKSLYTNYRSTQKTKRTKVTSTPRHNTLCGAPGCYSNCHVPCHLEKSFDKERFKQCSCMQGADKCTKCGHHYTVHYHNEVIFEEEEYTKEFVDQDMQQKFKEAETMEERARVFQEQLEGEQKQSESERKRLSTELLSIIEEFHKLGINRNYAKLLENQLAVIELRLEGTTGPETQHLRKTIEELKTKLELVQATLK